MVSYRHTVQYYETDKMGITHHSNYVRWMEEARVNYLAKVGCGYDEMEKEGIISPVLSVSCNYKNTTTFADVIEIRTAIKEFKGLRMTVEYEMIKLNDNSVVCTAESQHCFLNADFKPLNLKKSNPDYYNRLTSELNE